MAGDLLKKLKIITTDLIVVANLLDVPSKPGVTGLDAKK